MAGKFEMSGAQISNVAAKRDLAELYGEEDRGVDLSDFDAAQKKTACYISYRARTRKAKKLASY